MCAVNLTPLLQITDIKVQIEDERNKVDAEYNGDLSLIFPNKEDRRSVSIAAGRGAWLSASLRTCVLRASIDFYIAGIIKELPVTKSGKASFRLASSEKEEESGLSTMINVIAAAGKPAKFDLHMFIVRLSLLCAKRPHSRHSARTASQWRVWPWRSSFRWASRCRTRWKTGCPSRRRSGPSFTPTFASRYPLPARPARRATSPSPAAALWRVRTRSFL